MTTTWTAEDERAAVVKWLREQHDMRLRLHNEATTIEGKDHNLFRAATYGGAADAIERGDHLYPDIQRMKMGHLDDNVRPAEIDRAGQRVADD